MTTYYVGIGGNDGNNGTSWATRKLTLNGAEDIPVAAGDTVYVGPGTYREQLTCDTDGSSGNPITYIGDYTGEHTDGVGGIVRITGSDDDLTTARSYCIHATNDDYRTFRGLTLDIASEALIAVGGDNQIIEDCVFQGLTGVYEAIWCVYDTTDNMTVRNCLFMNTHYGINIWQDNDDAGHTIENCVFIGNVRSIFFDTASGGNTVKNCTIIGGYIGIFLDDALNAGQTNNVNNCLIAACQYGMYSDTVGDLVEDYNNFIGNTNDRNNVDVGTNSVSYPILFDTRWFHELINGGRLITPFDLASYSQIINVAGTSPTSTDMRGTGTLGAQREWGALEYDSTLFKKWVNRGMMGCG